MQEINNLFFNFFFLPTFKEGQSLSPRRLRMLVFTILSLHPELLYLKASTEITMSLHWYIFIHCIFLEQGDYLLLLPHETTSGLSTEGHINNKMTAEIWNHKRKLLLPLVFLPEILQLTQKFKIHFLINCFPGCFRIGSVFFLKIITDLNGHWEVSWCWQLLKQPALIWLMFCSSHTTRGKKAK